MQYISKNIVVEYLDLMIDKSTLVMERNTEILSYHEFLSSSSKMEKFDAACMLIQVVGETAKKIDDWTDRQLFTQYSQVYWRGVFGMRNIISHEYGNVDPEKIFGIIKEYLPQLVLCLQLIIADVESGKYDSFFVQ